MFTAADLLKLVFADSGVFGTGQNPRGEDMNRGLQRLNMLLAQWNRRRWLVYHLVEYSCPCVDGQQRYGVGEGLDFAPPRPDRIEAAFIRQTNVGQNIDYPLEIIESMEEYSQIALKSLQASPSSHLFYDSGFPTGWVYPWPIPSSSYDLHILVKQPLTEVQGVGSTLLLPPEYEFALYTTLVNLTRAAYRLPVDPYFIGQAKAALKTIRSSNFQLGRLSLPKGLSKGVAYNVHSDRGN